MNYQTYKPHPDLQSLVKCYWTLEIPPEADAPKQRIVPDGCIEMAFILGDDIRRYTSETMFIIQPRAMVIGQITEPYYIQPVGYVNTFAVRFYPYGFANFVSVPLKDLSNKETPLSELFGEESSHYLMHTIAHATDTQARIDVIENFLLNTLHSNITIDTIVTATVEALIETGGNNAINTIIKNDRSKRRQMERSFAKKIGLSPKQLGKVIRMQAALKLMLDNQSEKLINIAYEGDYYDQAHFIRDFKEFTGVTPSTFLNDEGLALSSLFYSKE